MKKSPLARQVALVAGATRGARRGIARALGEAGAVVYCTGRSVRGNPSPYNRPETIEETAELAREYKCVDADGRRPDWGAIDIDFSRHPPFLLELMRTGAEIQLDLLSSVSRRTRRFMKQLPAADVRKRPS